MNRKCVRVEGSYVGHAARCRESSIVKVNCKRHLCPCLIRCTALSLQRELSARGQCRTYMGRTLMTGAAAWYSSASMGAIEYPYRTICSRITSSMSALRDLYCAQICVATSNWQIKLTDRARLRTSVRRAFWTTMERTSLRDLPSLAILSARYNKDSSTNLP